MLKKLTQGEWESVKTRIQTKAGGYIGVASTPENAQMLAASKAIYEFVVNLHKDDPEILKQVNSILKGTA